MTLTGEALELCVLASFSWHNLTFSWPDDGIFHVECRFIVESCFTFDECDVYDAVPTKNVFGVMYCDAGQVRAKQVVKRISINVSCLESVY